MTDLLAAAVEGAEGDISDLPPVVIAQLSARFIKAHSPAPARHIATWYLPEAVERREAIAAAYVAGEKLGSIAKRYGISKQRVEQIARKLGCPARQPHCRARNQEPRG